MITPIMSTGFTSKKKIVSKSKKTVHDFFKNPKNIKKIKEIQKKTSNDLGLTPNIVDFRRLPQDKLEIKSR